MSILAREEILKLIKAGKVKIKPLKESQVGPASIDLHLGNEFRIFEVDKKKIKVWEGANYKKITKLVKVKDGKYFSIKPFQLVHAITKEEVELPDFIAGRIEGRSRFARFGLLIHLSSGFIQPGSKGKIVLEMINMSPLEIKIKPGIKICQIILEKVKGKAKYKGKFYAQQTP